MLTNIISSHKDKLSFILILIILKPVFDLTWNYHLFYLGPLFINLNRIIAFLLPLCLLMTAIIKIGIHKKIEFVFSFSIFLILFLSLLALFHNPSYFTVDETARIFAIFIIFILGRDLLRNEDIFFKYTKWIVNISILPTLVGYLQKLGIIPYFYWDAFGYDWAPVPRITAGYQHPTQYLGYILISVPCILFLYANKRISLKYFCFWMALTLPIITLTLHRATMIIVLLQIITYSCLWEKNTFKWILLISIPIFITVFFSQIYYVLTAGRDIISLIDFRGRTYTWRIYLNSLADKDFMIQLIGNGNSYLKSEGHAWPHSGYIKFLYSYGILGFFCFLLFAFDLLSRVTKGVLADYRTKMNQIHSSKYLLGLVIVMTWLVYSVTNPALNSTAFGWNFALIISYLYPKQNLPLTSNNKTFI